MAEWARVVNTTTSKFFREEEINIMRHRKLLALLQDRSRVSMNNSGKDMDWKVRFTENGLVSYHDGGTLGMNRFNRWKTATLDWRGYVMSESMTEKEMRMNRGVEAIIKYYSNLMKTMRDDADRTFGDKFYIDGNAVGFEDDYHGIESFMGDSGTPSTTQPIAVNSDSYAGLSTVLGEEDGTWSGNWPEGTGGAAYDFWSPLLVDYTSTVAASSGGWIASPKTWANTCVEAIRYLIINTMKNRNTPLDIIMVTAPMYRDVMNFHDPLQRIVVEKNGSESKMTKLGFPGLINIDGVDIAWEYAMPANTGYGFAVDEMELLNMYETIFNTVGPTYEDRTMSYLYTVRTFGNLRFNPRYFGKLKNFTA